MLDKCYYSLPARAYTLVNFARQNGDVCLGGKVAPFSFVVGIEQTYKSLLQPS